MTTTNINNTTAEHFIQEMDAVLDIGDWLSCPGNFHRSGASLPGQWRDLSVCLHSRYLKIYR